VTKPSVYLAWQKGIAWMPIIIGLLATMILPPLLGGVIWMLLPESLKQTINTLIGMGMMLLVMFLVTQVVKPLTSPERPKRLEEMKR
jgi:Na+-translocating ferredoxin:NAD+ oxidoreductase RnfD subunit